MTNMQLRYAKKQAHQRLLNAVISFNGARHHGAQQEIINADAELSAAQYESQQLLYPSGRRG